MESIRIKLILTPQTNSCGLINLAAASITGTWFTAAGVKDTTALLANLQATSLTFFLDKVKIGAAINYKVGYSYKQTSTSVALSGISATATWILVDGATTLMMTGVAGALAVLAF